MDRLPFTREILERSLYIASYWHPFLIFTMKKVATAIRNSGYILYMPKHSTNSEYFLKVGVLVATIFSKVWYINFNKNNRIISNRGITSCLTIWGKRFSLSPWWDRLPFTRGILERSLYIPSYWDPSLILTIKKVGTSIRRSDYIIYMPKHSTNSLCFSKVGVLVTIIFFKSLVCQF